MDAKKVLVVEDEEKISRLLKMYLERESWTVELADNGDDGLRKALEDDFDAIILDVFMPGKNGLEVLEGIRAAKDTPVLMLTAQNDPEAVAKGMELGADGYILKPFSPREIVLKVNELSPARA